MKLHSLVASCLVVAGLVECKKLVDVKGLEIQEEKQLKIVDKTEGLGGSEHEEHRRCRSHSRSHSHHHRRPHHRRRHHSHDRCRSCPPRDLCLCTEKIGNYTVITRPVPHCQAENACAMLGLRMARIDIANFMDATMAAFKCSGPFSQTWVKSWNGDDYGDKGLVMSTGSAAPGGSINEVLDGEFGRNVMCEPADCEVVKPDCRGCHKEECHKHHRKQRQCGCNPCHCRHRRRHCHHRVIRRCRRAGPPTDFPPTKMPSMKKPGHMQVQAPKETAAMPSPAKQPAQKQTDQKQEAKTVQGKAPTDAVAAKAVRWFPLNKKTKDLPADTVQILLQEVPKDQKTTEGKKDEGSDDDESDDETSTDSDNEDEEKKKKKHHKKVVAQKAIRATPVVKESNGFGHDHHDRDSDDDHGCGCGHHSDDSHGERSSDEDTSTDSDDERHHHSDSDSDDDRHHGHEEESKKKKKHQDHGKVVKIEV